MTPALSRRDLLRAGAVGVGGAAMSSVLPTATAQASTPGALQDIEHVIIWLQENRSFDHYFGTYPGVRGWRDPAALPGVFRQQDSLAPGGVLQPFHLATATTPGECLPDIAHDYGDQHEAWNNGAMDKWGPAHAGDDDRTYLGYYTRDDLAYYYAVADTFTLCDNYFCSVMGSTTSNRLYAMTGMVDPDGLYGGPVLGTQSITSAEPSGSRTTWGEYSDGWKTYPDALTDAGVSWKVYSNPDGDDQYNPMYLFEQVYPQNYPDGSAQQQRAATMQANLASQFPEDFLADLAAGTLPQVSWLIPPIVQSEHPSASPQDGENLLSVVATALAESPLWDKLAMFYTYDENGGFFDHVPPPTPPPGTPGEFAKGQSEPMGLGFRVPLLIVSPFAKGGFVCRDTFDHTSLLRFVETRFGVPIPNLSDWRRATVGDLTSAFNFAAPDFTMPSINVAPPTNFAEHQECVTEEATSTPYPTPTDQGVPEQEPGTRPSPSGPGPSASLPELPRPSLAIALGAAATGALWWLRRRREPGAAGGTPPA